MTGLVVSRVKPSEWRELRSLRLRALRSDPLAFGSTYEREAAFTDEKWTEWATEDASGDVMATFVAKRGDEGVGLIGAYRDDEDASLFHVIAMWVAPHARRQGVGSALLTNVEEWVRACGGAELQLNVTTAAYDARRLYERAGFRPDGGQRPSHHTEGLTEVSMRKSVG